MGEGIAGLGNVKVCSRLACGLVRGLMKVEGGLRVIPIGDIGFRVRCLRNEHEITSIA